MSAFKNEKKGTWTSKFYYTDWQGNRKQKKKEGFKTQREAKAFEVAFINSQNGTTDITFDNLAKHYLDDCKVRLKPTTYQGKEYMFNSKLIPYFGNVAIKDINPRMIRKWQTELISQDFEPTYLKTINNQLSAIMNHAVKYYGLRENPCVKAGSMGKKRAESFQFWTLDEFNNFIIHVSDKPMSEVIFNILFWTGARSGEVMALTLNDFDFDNNKMSINKNYARQSSEDLIMKPKTPKSVREISIPQFLSDMVKEYVGQLYDYRPTDRLFPITKYYLTHEMKRGVKLSNNKRIRVHDLRHSHASLLIEMGVGVLLISERLGHENIETTLQTYSHLYPNKHSEVASKLENLRQKNA